MGYFTRNGESRFVVRETIAILKRGITTRTIDVDRVEYEKEEDAILYAEDVFDSNRWLMETKNITFKEHISDDYLKRQLRWQEKPGEIRCKTIFVEPILVL